jgi:hypothetical protein
MCDAENRQTLTSNEITVIGRLLSKLQIGTDDHWKILIDLFKQNISFFYTHPAKFEQFLSFISNYPELIKDDIGTIEDVFTNLNENIEFDIFATLMSHFKKLKNLISLTLAENANKRFKVYFENFNQIQSEQFVGKENEFNVLKENCFSFFECFENKIGKEDDIKKMNKEIINFVKN